jgi:hypothetical protein
MLAGDEVRIELDVAFRQPTDDRFVLLEFERNGLPALEQHQDRHEWIFFSSVVRHQHEQSAARASRRGRLAEFNPFAGRLLGSDRKSRHRLGNGSNGVWSRMRIAALF